MTTTTRRQIGAYDYLNQTTVWIPRPPQDWVPIAEMDHEWRWNCAQILLRGAAGHADRYGWSALIHMGDAPDEVIDWEVNAAHQRERNPQAWIRTTKLYRALVADLPGKRRKLTALADRARHYNTCASRTTGDSACNCNVGPDADPTAIDAALVVIRELRAAAKKAERERLETEAREAKSRAWREWMDANPGLDPDTKRPWGVDEDGVNHSERHADNEHCHYDSCRNCGGYHCGLYCGLDDTEDRL
jgi:hypothetical protein